MTTADAPRQADYAATESGLAAGSDVARRQPPRHVTRTVPCPRCGAAAGDACQGRRGDRKRNHLERAEAATLAVYGKRLELPRRSLQDGEEPVTVKRSDPDVGGVDSEPSDDATLRGTPGSGSTPLAR